MLGKSHQKSSLSPLLKTAPARSASPITLLPENDAPTKVSSPSVSSPSLSHALTTALQNSPQLQQLKKISSNKVGEEVSKINDWLKAKILKYHPEHPEAQKDAIVKSMEALSSFIHNHIHEGASSLTNKLVVIPQNTPDAHKNIFQKIGLKIKQVTEETWEEIKADAEVIETIVKAEVEAIICIISPKIAKAIEKRASNEKDSTVNALLGIFKEFFIAIDQIALEDLLTLPAQIDELKVLSINKETTTTVTTKETLAIDDSNGEVVSSSSTTAVVTELAPPVFGKSILSQSTARLTVDLSKLSVNLPDNSNDGTVTPSTSPTQFPWANIGANHDLETTIMRDLKSSNIILNDSVDSDNATVSLVGNDSLAST